MIKFLVAIVVFFPYVLSIIAFLFSKLVWVTSLVGITIFANFNEKINQYILSKWSLILPVDFVNFISFGNLKALLYTVGASIVIGILLYLFFFGMKKLFKISDVIMLDVFLTGSILYITILVYLIAATGWEPPYLLRYFNMSLFFLGKFVRALLRKIDPDPTLDLNS